MPGQCANVHVKIVRLTLSKIRGRGIVDAGMCGEAVIEPCLMKGMLFGESRYALRMAKWGSSAGGTAMRAVTV